MAELKVFHDREGQTLTVWFSDPTQEIVCEEAGEEVVLMKDRSGRVIGFEKLNFSVPESDSLHVLVKTGPTPGEVAELDKRWTEHVQRPDSAIPWDAVRRRLIERE